MGFWDDIRSAFSNTSAADKARASMPAQAAQAPMPAGAIPSISLTGKPPAVVSAALTDIPRLAGAVSSLRNPDLAPGQKELRRRPPAVDGLAEVATAPRGAVMPAAAPKSEKPPHGLPDLAELALPLLAILRPMVVNAERFIRELPERVDFIGVPVRFDCPGAGEWAVRVWPDAGTLQISHLMLWAYGMLAGGSNYALQRVQEPLGRMGLPQASAGRLVSTGAGANPLQPAEAVHQSYWVGHVTGFAAAISHPVLKIVPAQWAVALIAEAAGLATIAGSMSFSVLRLDK